MSDKLYYLVSEEGCVYCVDGGFHKDESFGRYKAYKRVKAALAKAEVFGRYMRRKVRVFDQDGNEVSI